MSTLVKWLLFQFSLMSLIAGLAYQVIRLGFYGPAWKPILLKIKNAIKAGIGLNVVWIALVFILGREAAYHFKPLIVLRLLLFAWHSGLLFLIVLGPLWVPFTLLLRKMILRPDSDLQESRRTFLKTALMAPAAASFSVAPISMIKKFDLHMRQVHLFYPDLPDALNGLRIGQVSDVHIGMFVEVEALERAVDVLNRQNLHLFVMTGDLCDASNLITPSVRLLDVPRTALGSFACIGNHEYYSGLEEFVKALDQSQRVHLLRDAHHALNFNGAKIQIIGLDYPIAQGIFGISLHEKNLTNGFGRTLKQAQERDGIFRICLSHHPKTFAQTQAYGADLTISGHTHGGQVRSFTGSSIAKPFVTYVDGNYALEQKQLFVTSGLGHWMPLRINCPPEVAVVTLHKGPVEQGYWTLERSKL